MAYGYVRQAIAKQCAKCGREFVGSTIKMYCSDTCRDSRIKEKTCVTCGAQFTAPYNKHCSPECKKCQLPA